MQMGLRQVGFALICAWGTTIAAAQQTVAPARGPFAQQFAAECDALIDVAITRPYGMAWDTSRLVSAEERAAPSRAPRHVTMEPMGTPAAGWMLLNASRLLDEPRYLQAAMEVARGIAAAQATTGKIPPHVIFGPTAGGREEPQEVPERAATRASLAFLLELIDSQQSKPEAVTRTAQRAAQWLSKQQTADGAWPSEFDPDPKTRQSLRIIRLDDPDYRDTTYAMLMASAIMDDRAMTRSATLAVQKLIGLRLGDQSGPGLLERDIGDEIVDDDNPHKIAPLWSTAYRLNGTIDEKLSDFPVGGDVRASKLALQTLMGAYLITGERPIGPAMDMGAQALRRLADRDGNWKRVYLAEPTTAPSTEPSGFFDPLPIAAPQVKADELLPTLTAITQLKAVGRERYLRMLSAGLSVRQRLAAAVCGYLDDPLTLELPVARDEINQYLADHRDEFDQLSAPIPADTAGRLRRLWLLMLRTRLEQLAAAAATTP
jgi:hypothetical protein